jgi:hypothetical protein
MRQTDDPGCTAQSRPTGGKIIEADQTSSAGPWIDIP